jgi:hypothetical protein
MNSTRGIFSIWIVMAARALGCRPTAERQPVVEPQSTTKIIREAGVVRDEILDFDFFIDGQEIKKVTSVFISCGCTTIDIQQGNAINFERPIHVRIQMPAGNFGKGQQSFTLGFEDNTSLEGIVAYVYQPEPFFSPDKILFFEDITERTIRFYFPGEENVTINDVSVPQGMTWSIASKPQRFLSEVTFNVDRNLFDSASEGVIQITTSSSKKPTCQLPYLVLTP